MSSDPTAPRPRRPAVLLVAALVAVAGVVAFLALRPDGRGVDGVKTDEERAQEAKAPELAQGPGSLPSAPGGGAPRKPSRPAEEGAAGTEDAASAILQGTVLDDETGRPLEGAAVVVRAFEPGCPAPPSELFDPDGAPSEAKVVRVTMAEGEGGEIRVASVPMVHLRTGADGRFAAPWVKDVEADVYARQPGFVVGVACRQPAAGPVTIRLKRGLTIQGIVVRESGEPVPGATVDCVPDPAVQGVVGHVDVTMAGPKGGFVLQGLLPGTVRVSARHPKFVAATSEPVEPGTREVRLVLVPALHVAIRITPDDAKDLEAPTAQWTTDGRPPRTDLVLLQRADVPRLPDVPVTGPMFPAGQGIAYLPVTVPCDRATVTFVVKAVGYEPWTSPPLEIPREGGETTLEVPLRRDPNLGRLVVRVESEDGRALSWTAEGCEAEVGRRDNVPVPAGIILQASEFLDLPALPSGPYALRVRSPRHAPASVDATVPAGGTEEVRVRLRPAAQVRVKFVAPEALLVRFRLVQGREVARPFPMSGPAPMDPNAPEGEQALAAGADGILLSGLGTGRYAIEVVSPDLAAPATTVDLSEGETKDVEISVTRK